MENIVNRKLGILLISCILLSTSAMSQEQKKEDKPVRFVWNSELLIDNQTPLMQNAQTLQLIIHHRFGTMGNGMSDLYGIYAPSNIRLGLHYGITDWLTVGVGTEKDNKMQELLWKVKLLQQTRSGKIPVDITYIGNAVIDARDEDIFGNSYSFTNRFSYFNQIMVSRKLTDKISLLVAGSYSHFNIVDTINYSGMGHDKIGITFGGRYNFWNDFSFICEYDHPIDVQGDQEEPAKPNLGLGLEISTSTHAFSVFASNYRNIISQKNFVFNQNDFSDEGWLLGFNIIVRF